MMGIRKGGSACCEKMGVKKGPWTPEEDFILSSFIQQHGHPNWRALPKLAGLMRCGKSCRLRWVNYLRPDVKRGNFTEEEEDTIIKLHGLLGNRWSVIAARLPGRTDNEIKNFWHTHIKKRTERHHCFRHTTARNKKVCIETNQRPIQAPLSRHTVLIDQVQPFHSSVLRSGSLVPPPYEPQQRDSILGEINANSSIANYSEDNDMDFWYGLFLKAGRPER